MRPSQAQAGSAVVVVAGWEMHLGHPEEHKEKVARHRRLRPQPSHAFLYESRVLKGSSTLKSVGASCMILHARCRALWPRRNTAQKFEDPTENVTCTVLRFFQISHVELARPHY